MPGFLMFDEYKDLGGADMPSMLKAGLRRLPMSWVAHGIKGEYNIDLDPIAMLRGDGTDLLNFGEAYSAWISVRKIKQRIEGVAKRDADLRSEQHSQANEQGNGAGSGQAGGGRRQQRTKWKKLDDPGGELEVDIEIDASLPQLIKASLEKEGGKMFDVAEVHMCTTAQIDISALTPGNNNPAAGLIKTLAAAMLFNIIPYMSIVMKEVTIMDIDFDLAAEQNDPPQASLTLKFKKVKWVYHIINQSNMNLIDVYAEYDYKDRKEPDALPSLGVVVNPFG